MSLSPFPESYWLASADIPEYPALTETIETEIAVIGGGITGITTAYLLAKEGRTVVLATSGRLIGGTTGYTTAKVTAQHDLIYDDSIRQFGTEKAGLHYRANQGALEFMRSLVEQEAIACDWASEAAYVYATTASGAEKIRKEYEAYEKLAIPGAVVAELPLPVSIQNAIEMKDQARFHPVPYLVHLVKEFVRLGGRVFEHTMVDTVEEGEPTRAKIRDGVEIVCRDLVSCAHFPVFESGFYFARLHAETSYVLAARVPGELLPGMYISADEPKRSVRSVEYGGERLLLIGGESHKTGQSSCTIKHYEALEAWARERFGAEEFPYRWSSNDFVTTDKLPYIGRIGTGKSHGYVATGFRKWGMTTGTAAALLLRDMLTGRSNPYEELYSPSRFQLNPDAKTILVEGADVAGHLIAGKLEWLSKKTRDLGMDEGALLRIDGKKTAAYRDPEGRLHLVDATCTHMGCEVEWNDADRTWDCPCHGSRYDYRGEVIEGPATRPLKKLEE
ncbi:FAD-dependent oxidoreductase [Gorillibacterium timonense]|uniref:FAD-dependent oxidoreductase n=1 Tax=Gorillibacterium timonense TaxID=1689269 RepID=UPI00071C64C9|nr:FAD-dependent oxidoreductase [Gorillibacterium timonense]